MDLATKHAAIAEQLTVAIESEDIETIAAIVNDGSVVLMERFWFIIQAVANLPQSYTYTATATNLAVGMSVDSGVMSTADTWFAHVEHPKSRLAVLNGLPQSEPGFVLCVALMLASMSRTRLVSVQSAIEFAIRKTEGA